MARPPKQQTTKAAKNSPQRLTGLFLDMLAAERGAGRNTLEAYGRDLDDLADFLGRAKKTQPVDRLACFFQCNRVLANKVCPALSGACLLDVGANRSSRAEQLVP